MKNLLEYLQMLWNQAGYPGIAAVLGALVAALGSLSFVWNLSLKLGQLLQQRKLRKDLHPFYTAR